LYKGLNYKVQSPCWTERLALLLSYSVVTIYGTHYVISHDSFVLYINNFRNTCAALNISAFYGSLRSCFTGTWSVRKVSSHFAYLENRSRGLDV